MANRYQGRPFRTDDDDREHGQMAQPQGEADPLAELARLIGQADPFANVARDNPARGSREPQAPAFDTDDRREPTGFDINPGPPSWMQRVARRDAVQHDYEAPQAEAPYADEHDTGGHYAAPQQEYDYSPAQSRDPHEYSAQEHYNAPQGYNQPLDPARYDDALYGTPDAGSDQRYYPETDGYQNEGYDQQVYDEGAARKPRRGGMMTVVVVLALAVVGTAAAYAYRTFAGAPRSGEAPIIKADAGPNKIVPQNQSSDGSGKSIQDRITTAPGTERIVSREEQPLDVNAAKPAGPRVVFPPLAPNPNVGATPVTQASRQLNSGAANVVPGDEPRKVKTVSIRPDQADTAPTSNAAAAPAAPAARPSAAVRTAPAAGSAAPTAAAPMSLSPQGAGAQAMVTPPPSAPAASTTTSGGYLVQISSQASEADAKNSYRTLQGKFPSVLGSRPPVIERADLGDKGVHYRAMVGPFETRDEAARFCGSLKSAGGNCFIPRK
jgi:cell division septation protein DedD